MGDPVQAKPKILCVDDEPQVLEGIGLTLRRRYEVLTATSGAEALSLVDANPELSVILSDMRMPEMNGATFLARAREHAPDATRMLLTGYTDLDAAIAAVNEGQIFRFLTKPCAPPALLAAFEAAVEQHRLVTAEKVLLEQTLHGAIKALTDILALTSPAAFGRGTRIKMLVSELADHLGIRERWQVEVAAMISQLGHITLPPKTAEKVYFGQPLSGEEQLLVRELPEVTERLLGNIPRLETVREILARYSKPRPSPEEQAGLSLGVADMGAEILRVAVDFDAIETGEHSADEVLALMAARESRYDPAVLEALRRVRGRGAAREELRELPRHELAVGMVLKEDVKLPNGVLLAPRGYEITMRFLERLRTVPRNALSPLIPVLVRLDRPHSHRSG